MSFSLGGDGPFLPARKKSSGLGAMKEPPKKQAAGSGVQESVPAFTEPDIKVRAGDQTVQLPIDTPKNVVRIGSRKKFKSLSEVAQTAIAKSGGTVIPVQNIREPSANESKAGNPDARFTQAKTATAPNEDNLCRLVFILAAAQYGHTLEFQGKLYTAEQVKSAAEKAAPIIQGLVKNGSITQDDLKRCYDLYCSKVSCALPSQTGTSAPTDSPASTEANAAPSAPSTGITPYTPAQPPQVTVVELPQTKKPSSMNLWWLVAIIGGGLLIKKLAAVKVIGAAVAGAPLVADMGGEEEDEGGESEEEAHEAEEAHESEE